MERPLHNVEHVAGKTKQSRLVGLGIVIAIHVAVITALILGLAQGAILKQMQDIKASVEAQKVPPKAPPPPPPDLVKPPPPTAIVPVFSVETAAPPPITTVPKAPPAPKTTAVAPTELKAIGRTHTQPTYPAISIRLQEQGTSTLEVNINAEGSVTECKVFKTSGSDRLDQAACDHVKERWKWQPPTQEGKPSAATTHVAVVWDLKKAQ